MSLTPVDHTEKNIQEKSDEMWNYRHLVHKQNFVVMSIVDKDGDKPSVIKIFGTYNTLVEANKASEAIRLENDYFHVYVADTNEWIPIPPGDQIEDIVYQEERMKQIQRGYAHTQEAKSKSITDQIKKNNKISQDLDAKVEEVEDEEELTEVGVEETKG